MVALDENAKPTTIKPLEIRNETERKRFEEALARKQSRLKKSK